MTERAESHGELPPFDDRTIDDVAIATSIWVNRDVTRKRRGAPRGPGSPAR